MRSCTRMIPTSWWIVYDCSTLRIERATTLTTTRCCRGTSRSPSYYKLNRVSMKRISREKIHYFLVFCLTRRIMKKRSKKKREKISFERHRLVEELHAPARRNYLRRRHRDTTICDRLISLRCACTQTSIEATYLPLSMCWANTHGYHSRAKEARRLTQSLRSFERVEDVRKIYKRI